jgi:uncharacterized protein YlzI (FlbEa/FlbD family)
MRTIDGSICYAHSRGQQPRSGTVNVDQVLWIERHTDSTILTMNTQQWSVSVLESVEEILNKLKASYG